MGGKDSKPAFLTYEDAVKRVTEAELKRLKDAFKRYSTINGYVTKLKFIQEVFGDGVPPRLHEHMFLAFGGAGKGLSFKDLVCGLVVVTRGRQEEKIKFLFGIYANESLTHVQKEEMDALVLVTEGQAHNSLSDLFRETDRVTYEMFRQWVLDHPDATSVTRWLLKEPCSVTLSNDQETPTFFQTLAGVTHLEETDIIELEKRYWQLKGQSKTGRFDLETFSQIVSPPVPEALCEALFIAFDENRDNHIDFKEMACGISACCRGPKTERQKFCFKIFDTDHDGLLSRSELESMVDVMLTVRKENKAPEELKGDGLAEVTAAGLAAEILANHDGDKDGCITQEEYLVWTVSHTLPADFSDLLFQVCHIVLGLKPQNKEDEGQVIIGWLEREERKGLRMHQTWYLVSISWWHQWLDYVSYGPVANGTDDGTNNNLKQDGYKKTHSRSGSLSLCPNLGRKASFNNSSTEDQSGVVPTGYSSLPHNHVPSHMTNHVAGNAVTSSPTKYATIPRSTSPHSTAIRNNRSASEVYSVQTVRSLQGSPAHSLPSTPSMSPKIIRRTGAVQKPGAIDNSSLIMPNTTKVATLTNEGGRLKRDKMLARGRDFELLPEQVWKALSSWYDGSPALPRTVIMPSHGGSPELELYPIFVRLLRHQTQQQRPNQVSSFSGVMGGISGMVVNYLSTDSTGLSSQPATPRRYLARTAAFSRKHTLRQVYDFLTSRLTIGREDMRLWKFKDETNMTLLEEEDKNMEELGIDENMQILIEVRNKDLTWPEEMSQLAKNKAAVDKSQLVPTERGATGLNNLGNTCFMNSALQCVSNTRILTLYFTGGMHLYEINRTNVLGMKGHIAQRYGDLAKDLWSGTTKSIAPLKLRWTIGKYAPRFNGFQQHDSQELLAFLLDGLHEDLNRVHNKPYVELKDSDGRRDEIVAKEAWDNHLLRNRSIVVDLFHGQLKSCVRCIECGHTSVRFDPFTFLSLPLPMESCIHLEIIVIWLDGRRPTKYGVRLNMDEKYKGLKKQLSDLSGIPPAQLLLVEIFGALVKSFPQDNAKIKTLLGGSLYAYELPPVIIRPMSAEEEKGFRVIRQSEQNKLAQGGLSQIQRMHTKHNTSSAENLPLVNGTSKASNSTPGSATSTPQHTATSSPARPKAENKAVNDVSTGGTPNSPGHQRTESNVSTNSNSTSPGSSVGEREECLSGFIVAVHRKMIRMDVYFLSFQKTRPSLFGTPLILPTEETTTNQDLYQYVWTQVSRLVSPLPPSEAAANHALDCDDSLGYEYPFMLKAVQKDGCSCSWCPWYKFCRGCKIECNTSKFNFGSCYIAVDWEPTALHLRYQTSQERIYEEHTSVDESRKMQTEPIDLDACLKSFTKEEELGEDELYYCSKCKKHRLAAKKLEIWKLPPILVIHLKRFQFHNGRWVKSQKIVKFPVENFDPANYLAPRDLKFMALLNKGKHVTEGSVSEVEAVESKPKPMNGDVKHVPNGPLRQDSPSRSGLSSPGQAKRVVPHVNGDIPVAIAAQEDDLLSEDEEFDTSIASVESLDDYTNVRYNLYAMSCHTGILGGGHYVSYAKNPNNKWYCYNDSSCKEVTEKQLDTDSAYILFYERQSIDVARFMPDITGKEPDTTDIDDEFESDFKKMCVLQ